MKNEIDNPNKRLYYAIGIYAVVFLLVVSGILIYKLSDRKDFDFDDYSFPEDTVVSTKAEVSSVESITSLENGSSSTPQGLDPKFSKLLLVNGKNPLPNKESYAQNLTTIDAKYLCGQLNQMDKDVLPYATALMDAAWADGIDIRVGCHDIIIENITGFVQDDSVALTALPYNGVKKHAVEGESYDIYNVIIKNIMTSAFHSNVRLLNQCCDNNVARLYNILIDGVFDTSLDAKFYVGRSAASVRIGNFAAI